jgi:type IV secretion system protein VirB4
MKFDFKKPSQKKKDKQSGIGSQHKKAGKEVFKPDFIPYACHFNPGTILTKNGELMHVIRISGDSDVFENMSTTTATAMDQEFRSILRMSINQAVKSDHYSIWIHTLRRPTSRSLAKITSKENNKISVETDSVDRFVNDLYISILLEGQTFSLYDIKSFFRQLYFPAEFKYRMKYLEDAERELAAVTDSILKVISPYGAEQIGIIKEDGIYYSEIVRFLGKLVNLREEEWMVSPQDISEILPSHKLTFSQNIIELKGETGRHFGAVFTIKEYLEIHEQNLDELLRLPLEIVITESYDPMQKSKYLSEYKKIFEIQTSHETLPSANIKNVSSYKSGFSIENMLGEHQISIMVVADTLKELEENYRLVVSTIERFGLMIVREDVYMEDCYWAQLPGNFEFLKRLTPVETERVGGFAALHNVSRRAISRLRSISLKTRTGVEYPYFLHPEHVNHVLISGPPHSGKTSLMNYLLGYQDVNMPRVITLDKNRNSEIFHRGMDSDYYQVMPENALNSVPISLNPLLLSDNEENRLFLKMWVSELMMKPYALLPEIHRKKIDELVDLNYTMPVSERLINRLVMRIWKGSEEDSYSENISKWCKVGYYRSLFEHQTDIFSDGINENLGIDLTSVHNDHFLHGPVMFYLMHRISQLLDGTPTVLALENGLNLLNLPSLAPHIPAWLTSLSKQNTTAVFTLESSPHNFHPLLQSVATMCGNKFYLAGTKFNTKSINALGLDTPQITALESLSSRDREIYLTKSEDSTVLHLHLSQNPLEYAILSSTHRSLNLMFDSMRKNGPYAKLWMPDLEKHLS